MNFKQILIATLLSFSSLSLFAGVGHDHGHGHGHGHAQQAVSAETAQKNAEKLRDMMVRKEVLDESWKTVAPKQAEKKTTNGQQEWLVTFVNEKSTDPEKKTLFVFLTLGGQYVAANFNGK
jgi:hypothetical protein